MAKTSRVTITYVTDSALAGGGVDLSLELDAEKNQEVYGVESKTRFAPGETAYLKLISSSDESYTIDCSYGTPRRQATNIPYSVTENLTFAKETQATLSHLPMNTVTWDWIGNDGGTPLFTNRLVEISEEDVAVLHCEYQTLGDRLRLVVSNSQMTSCGYDEISVLVHVTQGEETTSTSVTYSTAEGGGAPVPVELKVADFCDKETMLEDVAVYIDGVNKGQTNSNGVLYIGEYVPGTTHTLHMTKDGYRDSDADPLSNDSFMVPVPETQDDDEDEE